MILEAFFYTSKNYWFEPSSRILFFVKENWTFDLWNPKFRFFPDIFFSIFFEVPEKFGPVKKNWFIFFEIPKKFWLVISRRIQSDKNRKKKHSRKLQTKKSVKNAQKWAKKKNSFFLWKLLWSGKHIKKIGKKKIYIYKMQNKTLFLASQRKF